MLTGKAKVEGFRHMGAFGKLFAKPRPEDSIAPGAFMASAAVTA